MINVIEYIEEHLLTNDIEAWENKTVGAFLIHPSVFDKIQNLPNVKIQNVWDYELHMAQNSFSMKLVYAICDFDGTFKNMFHLCRCDVIFPWEDNLTLFVPLQWYSILEKYIVNERLDLFVKSTEDQEGIFITSNEMIRVVRFTMRGDTKKRMIKDGFREFLRSHIKSTYYPTSLYCKVAFPWLQPWILEKFDAPSKLNNPFFTVIRIILENTNIPNNIFDLVAVRMAFCDCRNLQPTAFIQSVIDGAIVRLLRDPKYIINNGFKLEQYMFDKNIFVTERIESLMQYFVYVFQHFLGISIEHSAESRRDRGVLKLTENSDCLNMLYLKSNFEFKIDGRKFDRMSFKLFNDLAGCHNVREITLDTNYHFDNCLDGINHLKFSYKLTFIYLLGNNSHNFIEKFTSCIKKLLSDKFLSICIYIDCELSNYSIFNKFPIYQLVFRNIKINSRMLFGLSNISRSQTTRIVLTNCKFVYNRDNWILLNNIKQLEGAEILEEEDTWESLFDFVAYVLSNSGTNEYEFNRHINIITPNKTISLAGLKFTIDEYKTKLDIRIASTNEILDLFLTKFLLEEDGNRDHDFYQ